MDYSGKRIFANKAFTDSESFQDLFSYGILDPKYHGYFSETSK